MSSSIPGRSTVRLWSFVYFAQRSSPRINGRDCVMSYLRAKLINFLVGDEPFPFPFPSTTAPTLISASNPAPAPTGPRAMNSTPVPNPYPPVYIPGPSRTPFVNTGGSSPATGSGTRAQLTHHHQGSPPGSGLRNEFSIRGMAGKNANGGSPRYINMGQAYNNRPSRGRGIVDREPRQNLNSEPVGSSGRGPEHGGSNGNGGGSGGVQRGRGAVYAARRQLKIVRRAQGRN